jgi:hypothetical protein
VPHSIQSGRVRVCSCVGTTVSQIVATALDIGKHHSPAALGRKTAEILEGPPEKMSAEPPEGQHDPLARQELLAHSMHPARHEVLGQEPTKFLAKLRVETHLSHADLSSLARSRTEHEAGFV